MASLQSPHVVLGCPASLSDGETWDDFSAGGRHLGTWLDRVQEAVADARRIGASDICLWTPHVPDAIDPGRMMLEWRERAIASGTSGGQTLADRGGITEAFIWWAMHARDLGLYLYAGMVAKSPMIGSPIERRHVEGLLDANLGPIVDIARAVGILRGVIYDSLGDHQHRDVDRTAEAIQVVAASRRLWPGVPIGGEPWPLTTRPVRFDFWLGTRASLPHTTGRPESMAPRLVFYSDPKADAPPTWGYEDCIEQVLQGKTIVVQSHQVNEKSEAWTRVLLSNPRGERAQGYLTPEDDPPECETCLGAGRIRDGDTNDLRKCLDCNGAG